MSRGLATTLVLAAGRGTRAGGPKALLAVNGEPLALLHARARLAAESERVVLVVRASVATVLRARSDARVTVVTSEAPDDLGPAGSIQAAVRAGALDRAGAVLVTPVDTRPVGSPTTRALLEALDHTLAARFVHGHPVALRASVLRACYRDGAPRLRDVLASLPCAVLPTPNDAAALDDLDDPASIRAALGFPPAFATR